MPPWKRGGVPEKNRIHEPEQTNVSYVATWKCKWTCIHFQHHFLSYDTQCDPMSLITSNYMIRLRFHKHTNSLHKSFPYCKLLPHPTYQKVTQGYLQWLMLFNTGPPGWTTTEAMLTVALAIFVRAQSYSAEWSRSPSFCCGFFF